MKKLILTTALLTAMGSTAAFAHHPAADIIDPDVYAMIEENISDVHLDMTFDDMGGDTSDVGGTMAAADTDAGNMGDAMAAGSMAADIEDAGAAMAGDIEDIGAAMEAREEANAMADVAAAGPQNAR